MFIKLDQKGQSIHSNFLSFEEDLFGNSGFHGLIRNMLKRFIKINSEFPNSSLGIIQISKCSLMIENLINSDRMEIINQPWIDATLKEVLIILKEIFLSIQLTNHPISTSKNQSTGLEKVLSLNIDTKITRTFLSQTNHKYSEFAERKRIFLLLCGSILFWNNLLKMPSELIRETKIFLNDNYMEFVAQRLASLSFDTGFKAIKTTLNEIFEKAQLANPDKYIEGNFKPKMDSLKNQTLNEIFSNAFSDQYKISDSSWINKTIKEFKEEIKTSNKDPLILKSDLLSKIQKIEINKTIKRKIVDNKYTDTVALTLLNNLDKCNGKVSNLLNSDCYLKQILKF